MTRQQTTDQEPLCKHWRVMVTEKPLTECTRQTGHWRTCAVGEALHLDELPEGSNPAADHMMLNDAIRKAVPYLHGRGTLLDMDYLSYDRKDALRLLDEIEAYVRKHGRETLYRRVLTNLNPVSYTHLTLPTICSV